MADTAQHAGASLRVVPIAQYRARDTVTVLTHLLQQARLGKLAGIAVTVALANGGEEIVLADTYRKSPRKASDAATRMFWRCMQLQDDEDDA